MDMSKSFALVVVFVFLSALVILLPAPVEAQSKTIVVPDDYSTIGAAIVNAAEGDSLYVKSGTYEETTLTINKSISIIGEDIASTYLILNPPYGQVIGFSPSGNPEYGYFDGMKIVADNVEISGFTVVCENSSIVVSGSGTQITNNIFSTNLFFQQGENRIVTGNILKDITSESDNTFIGNNTLGSLFSHGSNVRLEKNLVWNVDSNTCCFIFDSDHWVEGNVILGKYGMGIRGQGNTVFDNMVVNSKIALYFDMDAGNNIIYHNNFINNTVAVQMSSLLQNPSVAVWDKGSEIGGNYWSDYLSKYPNAAEIDNSGLGNTPYFIDANNQDKYPLLHPLNITLDSLSTLPFSISSLLVQNVPPKISVLSPLDLTYNESSVSLDFFVDKQVDWVRYSLDGIENVTISGNSTITNLTNGSHNVTLYVKDTFGNIVASKIVIFSIATTTLGTQESFPTVPVIAVSGVSLTVIAIGLMAYFKKRKH
jgi:hypothetical protein